MHAMISLWTPPSERSRVGAIIYSGAPLGTVLALPFSAFICEKLGWQSVYYILSLIGVVWVGLWMLFAANEPKECKWMKDVEKAYIVAQVGMRDESRVS